TAHAWDISENNLLDVKAARASFVRFISADGVRIAREIGAGVASGKGEVLHVGVPLPPEPNFARRTADKAPVILCPASLYPVKAQTYLIEAMKLLHDRGVNCELWLAGDGELREELRRQTDALRLHQCIQFLGRLPHQKLI